MTRLEYFKNEIIKILDRQEQEDNAISKSIECFEYVKSLNNTMGTIQKPQKMFSTWKINGKDVPVKKIAPGKWVRVYNEQTKGAEQTIARLKSEINKCKNSQELLNIILRNKHRFENKNGELLPIINELNKFIDKKNKRLETSSKPMWKKEYYNLCEFDKKVIDTWTNEDIRKEAISLSPQANLLKKQGKELIKKNLKKAGKKLINAGKYTPEYKEAMDANDVLQQKKKDMTEKKNGADNSNNKENADPKTEYQNQLKEIREKNPSEYMRFMDQANKDYEQYKDAREKADIVARSPIFASFPGYATAKKEVEKWESKYPDFKENADKKMAIYKID